MNMKLELATLYPSALRNMLDFGSLYSFILLSCDAHRGYVVSSRTLATCNLWYLRCLFSAFVKVEYLSHDSKFMCPFFVLHVSSSHQLSRTPKLSIEDRYIKPGMTSSQHLVFSLTRQTCILFLRVLSALFCSLQTMKWSKGRWYEDRIRRPSWS